MVPKLTGSGGVSSFNGRFRTVFEILAVDLPFGQRDASWTSTTSCFAATRKARTRQDPPVINRSARARGLRGAAPCGVGGALAVGVRAVAQWCEYRYGCSEADWRNRE